MPQWDRNQWTTAATTTGSVVNTWNNFNNTSVPTMSPSRYRIVCGGIIIRNIAAPLSASGMIHLRSWANMDLSSFLGVDLTSYANTEQLDVPLQQAKAVRALMPHTSAMPQTQYDVADDTAVVASARTAGFAPLTIGGTGLPVSTPVFEIELVCHYELIFDATDALALLTTPSPPASAMVSAAAASATSAATGFFTETAGRVATILKERATRAIVGYLTGGRAGAIRGAIMDAD
jgi:hypothetical protein